MNNDINNDNDNTLGILTNNDNDNTLGILTNNKNNKGRINKTTDKKKYMKEYRKKNMDKWNENKICIECGGSYTSSNSSNHLRSKKHQYGMIAIENQKLQEIKNIMLSVK
jgi:hypothetical protein